MMIHLHAALPIMPRIQMPRISLRTPQLSKGAGETAQMNNGITLLALNTDRMVKNDAPVRRGSIP
jgi:hypothetical protein